MVSPAADMTWRPTSVLPVKLIMSIRGSVVSSWAGSMPDGVTTLTTPGGMSVCSSMRRASASPASGVSGEGLSTTVLPAASA